MKIAVWLRYECFGVRVGNDTKQRLEFARVGKWAHNSEVKYDKQWKRRNCKFLRNADFLGMVNNFLVECLYATLRIPLTTDYGKILST